MKQTAAIVGGGFSGSLTALHLARLRPEADIYIINTGYPLAKGAAYGTQCGKFLLNVPAAKMSAFPSDDDHFLNWLMEREPYSRVDKNLVGKMFVPRCDYGKYLQDVFQSGKAGQKIHSLHDQAINVVKNEGRYVVQCAGGTQIHADVLVVATGNEDPVDPSGITPEVASSTSYFRNPWMEESYKNCAVEKNALIIGNGLTMVDTVLGLLENGFKGIVYSLSPNGFNILPHRHAGIIYTKLLEELDEPLTIGRLFSLFHRHTKLLRQFGISAEPLVDSIRPLSQVIWKKLSHEDKLIFLSRFRHLWGVARHRLPLHLHDLIQQLRIQNKLVVMKGRLDAVEKEAAFNVSYFDASGKRRSLQADRIINCTGPLLDIARSKNPLLQSLLLLGLVRPDRLRLGIDTADDGAALNDEKNSAVYAIGGLRRGSLWESTAIPELRVQAEQLAKTIALRLSPEVSRPVN